MSLLRSRSRCTLPGTTAGCHCEASLMAALADSTVGPATSWRNSQPEVSGRTCFCMVAARLRLLAARRTKLRSTRDDTRVLNKAALLNRFCKATENSNKRGGGRTVTAALRGRWRSGSGALPPKSQGGAISKAMLPVLLYRAYGLTIVVLFLQWTGLPVSSEPQDPERLRPSTLIAGIGKRIALARLVRVGQFWQPRPYIERSSRNVIQRIS